MEVDCGFKLFTGKLGSGWFIFVQFYIYWTISPGGLHCRSLMIPGKRWCLRCGEIFHLIGFSASIPFHAARVTLCHADVGLSRATASSAPMIHSVSTNALSASVSGRPAPASVCFERAREGLREKWAQWGAGDWLIYFPVDGCASDGLLLQVRDEICGMQTDGLVLRVVRCWALKFHYAPVRFD